MHIMAVAREFLRLLSMIDLPVVVFPHTLNLPEPF